MRTSTPGIGVPTEPVKKREGGDQIAALLGLGHWDHCQEWIPCSVPARRDVGSMHTVHVSSQPKVCSHLTGAMVVAAGAQPDTHCWSYGLATLVLPGQGELASQLGMCRN